MSTLFNDEEQYVLVLHQLGSNMYSYIPSDLKDRLKCFAIRHSNVQSQPYVRVSLCLQDLSTIWWISCAGEVGSSSWRRTTCPPPSNWSADNCSWRWCEPCSEVFGVAKHVFKPCESWLMFCHPRKANAWFLRALLTHEPFRTRAPTKEEITIVLESLNTESKADTQLVSNTCLPYKHDTNLLHLLLSLPEPMHPAYSSYCYLARVKKKHVLEISTSLTRASKAVMRREKNSSSTHDNPWHDFIILGYGLGTCSYVLRCSQTLVRD